MKKFLSIFLVISIIVVAIVGTTACVKDDEPTNELIGTWFGKKQVEEENAVQYYYTEITQDEENKNRLVYKQYSIFPAITINNELRIGSYYDFPQAGVSAVSGQLHCKFIANNVMADFYKVKVENSNKYIVTRWDGKEEKTPYSGSDYSTYVFERTTMTLEEFRATYGKDTIEK